MRQSGATPGLPILSTNPARQECPMVQACQRLAAAPLFQNTILVLILLTAVLMGIETTPGLMAAHGGVFTWINKAIQAAFVVEIIVRLVAHWPRPGRFFRDGWNVFDFVVVAMSLVPAAGPMATVARVARLLRVTRLISVHPQLRLLVETMLKSLPGLGAILLLLGMILYVYAILGVHLFREADPARWGHLGVALLTLFEIVTLEGWVEIMGAASAADGPVWLFFVSFIVLAVFLVVNLFIAVVISNLETIHQAEEPKTAKPADEKLSDVIRQLRRQLDEVEQALAAKGRM